MERSLPQQVAEIGCVKLNVQAYGEDSNKVKRKQPYVNQSINQSINQLSL